LDDEDILQWIKNSAGAVKSYYGEFPVEKLHLEINISSGQGVHTGKAFGHNGPLIRVGIGRNSKSFHLKNDWVMTHEMVHYDRTYLESTKANLTLYMRRSMGSCCTVVKQWRQVTLSFPEPTLFFGCLDD